MFEEEAEEYKDNTRIKDKNTYIGFPDERISEVQDYEGNYIDISERIIKTFKDGATFGYNKAKEEMQKNGLALQSDMDKTIEQNIQLKKELNKANEWHYVKDKLPEEDVYVYLLCKKDDYPVVARRHIFYGETEWKWDCKWGSGYKLKADSEKVIAWKEIVLPKELENDQKD